jgi:predicted amidohydrolase YtcJ
MDAHVHLRYLAESRAMVDCETATLEECLSRVRNAAQKLPEDAWVRGHGWNQNVWPEGFGTAAMLDAVCGDRPAFLTAKSLHAAWANSAALAMAGIDAMTPDPPGGTIQRDAKGNLTGILLEGEATALIESIIPKPTVDSLAASFKNLFTDLYQMGLVGVHDFDGYDCWLALRQLHLKGDLNFRVRKNVPFDHLDDFISVGLQTDSGDDWLNIGNVKLFSDGALGPQTGAMLTPYEGSQNVGTLLLTENEIVEIGKETGSHGLALAIHAIGDRANRVVLNAYEKLRKHENENALPHYRHRIEHVQVISAGDLPRLATLDIIASVQPIHAPSDMLMADRFLGERANLAYAYQSLAETGAMQVFGSDAPVESVNPFHGIHAAVTRQRLDGSPGPDGWHTRERLSMAQAIAGFSHTPALAAHRGTHLGRIAPGYKADLLILPQNPFTSQPEDLSQMKPLATFLEGQCVYQDSAPPFDL